MRFSAIEIKNFRQYKNLNFHFKKNKENDLHVIVGQNGMGKTNILNAIAWCLYGDEPHLGDASKSLPKLNLESAKEAVSNGIEKENVTVKILAEDEGQNIIYQRTIPINTSTAFEYKEEFKVSVSDQKGDTKIYQDEEAKQYVNKYMPEKIRQYFYFDGEQLHNYFISDQSLKIKDSINTISQVDMLTSISSRLEKIILKKQKEAGNKKPDIKEWNLKIDSINKIINDNKTDIIELEEQISKSQKIIDQNTEHLRGQENLPELEDRRKILKEKLEKYENEKIVIHNELLKFVRDYKIILSFYPYVKRTVDIINEKIENNSLPPNIDKNLLTKMLKNHKCMICDRELTVNDEKKIEILLEKIKVSTDTSHLLLNIQAELQSILESAKKYPEERECIFSKRKDNQNYIDEVGKELQKVDNDIEKFSDKEQIINWHKERESHEKLKVTNIQKLGVAKKQLEDALIEKEEFEKKLAQALSKEKECEKINKMIELSKKSKEVVLSIKNEMMLDIKNKMEDATMNYFNNLIWKKNTYEKIELDERYRLDLYHQDGYSCVGSCSAAERSLLALSFTLALHQVSGFDSLLFIDTPVARVSDLNRINFANVLNEVSKDKQIIMTFSPDEYSEEIRKVFENNLSTFVQLSTENEKVTTFK